MASLKSGQVKTFEEHAAEVRRVVGDAELLRRRDVAAEGATMGGLAVAVLDDFKLDVPWQSVVLAFGQAMAERMARNAIQRGIDKSFGRQ